MYSCVADIAVNGYPFEGQKNWSVLNINAIQTAAIRLIASTTITKALFLFLGRFSKKSLNLIQPPHY